VGKRREKVAPKMGQKCIEADRSTKTKEDRKRQKCTEAETKEDRKR